MAKVLAPPLRIIYNSHKHIVILGKHKYLEMLRTQESSRLSASVVSRDTSVNIHFWGKSVKPVVCKEKTKNPLLSALKKSTWLK